MRRIGVSILSLGVGCGVWGDGECDEFSFEQDVVRGGVSRTE